MRSVLAAAMVAGTVICSGALTVPSALAGPSGLPMPPRSRQVSERHYVSSKTFRKTVVFFRRHLSNRGYQHVEVPVYGYRGVIVSRFIAEGASPWLAIHVFRVAGKTHIYVVPAEKPAPKPGGQSP